MTIVAQTNHYQIIDNGADYAGRFVKRFALEIKPEFAKTKTRKLWASADSAELLMSALTKAEEFHTSNTRSAA